MKIFGTDYDGVIINIEPQKAIVFANILNKYWKIDKDEAADFWIASQGISRKSMFGHFYQKVFNTSLSEKEYIPIEQEFSTTLKIQLYPKAQLLPHVHELLTFARNNFDYMFISSGIPVTRDELRTLVKSNGVFNYFDTIFGTSRLYQSKKEHFKEIIGDYKPDFIIYIADGLEDVRAAKEFDIITIGIPTNQGKQSDRY